VKIPFVSSIAVLGLLQIIVWFACFMIVATILKNYEYPDSPYPLSPNAVFMREWGLILTMIPSAWILWASWDVEANESPMFSQKIHLVTGAVMLAIALYLSMQFVGQAVPMKTGPIQSLCGL